MSVEHIAEAARRHLPGLSERLALDADAILDSLEAQRLVAWDRELLLGRVQGRMRRLHAKRVRVEAGPPVTVYERRRQPLESIELVWTWLRRGRSVRLEYEAGASPAMLAIQRRFAGMLPTDALVVADDPTEHAPEGIVGVARPGPRIALIHRDADRELAAYVLARTTLRRNGFDPRSVQHAYVSGPADLLRRHLTRLWVGVQVGRADDPGSFAGPVTEEERDAFLGSYAAWHEREGVATWCEGGALDRTDGEGLYLAPAAFAVEGEVPDLPCAGPLVVLVVADPATAEAAAARARDEGGDVIAVGGPPRRDVVRHVRGALLMERLPPGLPDPRPV